MDYETFDLVVDHILGVVEGNLKHKGAEYAPEAEASRFHNFEVAAAFNGISTEEALWGMLTKHLVSLSDMVKQRTSTNSPEKWDEKIGDALTYLVLLKGMVTNTREIENLRLEHSLKNANVDTTQAVVRHTGDNHPVDTHRPNHHD